MASCAYCDSYILFGGTSDQSGRYCNGDCQRAGNLLLMSQGIPDRELEAMIEEVHLGNCPRCQRPGPIDVHKAHKVWSALVLTSWSCSPALSCKSCATKRQLGAVLFSGALGWWGLPWGLIMTPFQIIRNVVEMTGGPRPGLPSPLLKSVVRMQAAAQYALRPPPIPQGPPPPVTAPSDLWQTAPSPNPSGPPPLATASSLWQPAQASSGPPPLPTASSLWQTVDDQPYRPPGQ